MAPKTRRGARAAAATKPPAKPKPAATLPPPALKPSAAFAPAAAATPVVPAAAAASATAVTAFVSVAAARDSEAPRKKRRTLRDAEHELEVSRHALQEAKKKLIVTARENAKMKVLLMKYIDKDDSLLCTSQLSMASQQEAPPPPPPPSAALKPSISSSSAYYDSTQSTSMDSSESTAFEESENSESSLWTSTSEFQTDDPDGDDADALMMMGPVSQLSQMSQMSQWSEFSSTSNLDEIITFLEKQDTVEHERVVTLESEFKELQAQKTHVRVGVGVILTSKQHPQCVLIGQRKGSHGAGKFALPGGHLEMFESWEECAIREVKEETDLDVRRVKFAYVTNDPMPDDGKHYITIFVQAEVADDAQEPKNMEPDKCEGWHWEPWQRLRERENMFVPLYHITRSAFAPAFD